MKKILGLALLLAFTLFGDRVSAAEGNSSLKTSKARPTPGLEAAQAISTITGVAISPLLGVSGIGVWTYYKAPIEKRAGLAWYAQPWFWGPALLLLAVVFIKDTFGTALPTVVKKPLDVLEAFENKISGLVAAGAFVPLIATIFSAMGEESALYGDAGLAMIDGATLLNVLAVPLAVAAFVVVWMVSHVINVLILISPFTTVDAALKSARLFLLSTVAATAWANPYVGAAWSLVIILICALLAGWALRLMIFGSVFTWDLLTFRSRRFTVEPEANWVFTARAIGQTPVRTYGKLSRGPQGELVVNYRPWLLLPRQKLALPAGRYAVGRGLLYPEIVQIDGNAAAVLTMPPRCCGHEAQIRSLYALDGVRDVGLIKGLKAVWNWLRGTFRVADDGVRATV